MIRHAPPTAGAGSQSLRDPGRDRVTHRPSRTHSGGDAHRHLRARILLRPAQEGGPPGAERRKDPAAPPARRFASRPAADDRDGAGRDQGLLTCCGFGPRRHQGRPMLVILLILILALGGGIFVNEFLVMLLLFRCCCSSSSGTASRRSNNGFFRHAEVFRSPSAVRPGASRPIDCADRKDARPVGRQAARPPLRRRSRAALPAQWHTAGRCATARGLGR